MAKLEILGIHDPLWQAAQGTPRTAGGGRAPMAGDTPFTLETPASRLSAAAAVAEAETTRALHDALGGDEGKLMGFEEAEVGETFVGSALELKNGQKKTVEYKGEQIMLCRVGGQLFATSAKCTHAGAPLDKGVLSGDRIMCQWHGACFNVKTGDIEEGMVFDPLKTYRVREDGEKVFISDANRRVVIVGGGASGVSAAHTLRREGYTGQLTILSSETTLPYDLTKCSKLLARGPNLRNEEYYRQNNIEVQLNTRVAMLDGKAKLIETEAGETIRYDTAILCTGGRARHLSLPGDHSSNIFYLHSAEEAERLRRDTNPSSNVVVIGNGVLGTELAASLKMFVKVSTVVVVDSGNKERKFQSTFGPSVFEVVLQMHVENGVIFKSGPAVRLVCSGDKVVSVCLRDGTVLPCDILVVAIGIEPNTGFLCNVPLLPDRTVEVDSHCKVVGVADLYAAGDIVSFPLQGMLVRVEHWGVAMELGRIAARNVAGRPDEMTQVPVFWTNQYGKNFRFCGVPLAMKPGSQVRPLPNLLRRIFMPWEKPQVAQAINQKAVHQLQCIPSEAAASDKDSQASSCVNSAQAAGEKGLTSLVIGDVSITGKFAAYYGFDDLVVGVASYMYDPIVAASAELMRRGEMPSMSELRAGVDPVEHLVHKQKDET